MNHPNLEHSLSLDKEKDRVSRLPIFLILTGFVVVLSSSMLILWFVYQNFLTQIVVNVESQTTFYERDLQRAYEDGILKIHLEKAIQSTLRRYAVGNPSSKTAKPPHSGPPDRRFSILAPPIKKDSPHDQ